MLLISDVANCVIGFTDRSDGDAKNLGARATFLIAAGLDPKKFVCGEQVHGNQVRVTTEKSEITESDGSRKFSKTDGIVTDQSGFILGAFSADCIPLILIGERSVAAVHSGWRGLAQRIADNAVAKMGKARRAYIGPHIRKCCYEVGAEVAEKFAGFAAQKDATHFDLDMTGVIRQQLTESGVTEIQEIGGCTFCDERYFSHRRDQAPQRMVGFISKL